MLSSKDKEIIEALNKLVIEAAKEPKPNIIVTRFQSEEEMQQFVDDWNVVHNRTGDNKIKMIPQPNGVFKLEFP